MPRPYPLKKLLQVLCAHGFVFISQNGSHAKYRSLDGKTVIVPVGEKEVRHGTWKSIVRQSGLEKDDFENV